MFGFTTRFALICMLATVACDGDVTVSDAGPGTIPGNLSGSDSDHSDRFGSAVALSGELMAVGAPGDDSDPADADERIPESGAVFVYERSGVAFNQVAKLKRPDADPRWGDRFGAAVALVDDLLLIGAPGAELFDTSDETREPSYRDSGAVYVFQGSGSSWTLVATIESPAPFIDQQFGSAVTASGDTVIIGASGADLDSRDVGTVIVFHRDGTTFTVATDTTASLR